jgi:hypothetical protein
MSTVQWRDVISVVTEFMVRGAAAFITVQWRAAISVVTEFMVRGAAAFITVRRGHIERGKCVVN